MASKMLLIRLDPNIYSLVKKVAGARGETVSTFVRRAVLRELANLNFLDEEQRKILRERI